jgi:uncharacterized membrane protein YfhO
VRAADTSKAKIDGILRTQSTFTFDVDAAEPTRILLNTTWDAGWRTTVGAIVNSDKLLALDVPAGRSRVLVKYWPRGLTFGFFLTFAGIAGTVAFYVLDAKRRRRIREREGATRAVAA